MARGFPQPLSVLLPLDSRRTVWPKNRLICRHWPQRQPASESSERAPVLRIEIARAAASAAYPNLFSHKKDTPCFFKKRIRKL